jgi:hypothetical protein
MRQALLAGANQDGGWGYYPGRPSRLEPTCWALLALLAGDPAVDWSPEPHARFLRESQRPDGLLLEAAVRDEDRPNLGFNGLAALLMLEHPQLAPEAFRLALVAAVARNKGVKVSPAEINRQDNDLQGWAWIDASFSWVEPTCWCSLALKKSASTASEIRARISEADRLLADRCCAAGGWNYGNSNMLGQDLRPYVSTTALGLLAMQDRPHEACVRQSLEYLRLQWLSERSARALGLALIALRTFGLPAEDVEASLRSQWERTRFLGSSHLVAIGLFSLQTRGAFRV